MSVLSNKQIIESHASGQIVIEPFTQGNVRKASLDLTLGEWFYRGSSEEGGVYNPFDEDDVRRNYAGPYQAKPYFNVWRKLGEPYGWPVPQQAIRDGGARAHSLKYKAAEFGLDLVGIPDDHPIIMLLPGEFILAHTHEFVGIRPPGTSEMRARSSWGRNRVSACLCAGWGDPGYINRWTMEVHNLSRKAIPLPVGERISQLIFHESGDVYGGQYGAENGYTSKYQESTNIADVIADWRPEKMLPRSYMDERRMTAEIRYAVSSLR